jgi:hypothetical protein
VAGLGELGYQAPATSSVLTQLRGSAKGILLVAYGILALCVLFFIFGIGDAFTAWQQANTECSIRLDDGTCLGQ